MTLIHRYTFLFIFFGLIIFSYFYFNAKGEQYKEITSFDECIKSGFPISTTYPERCLMPGKSFVNPRQQEVDTTSSSSQKRIEQKQTLEQVFKDLSYFVEGQQIEMQNGVSVLPSNQSFHHATMTLVMVEPQLVTDINGDMASDTLFLLQGVDTLSGKRMFYITGAITLNDGFVGLNALPLDSDIASTTPIMYTDRVFALGYMTSGGEKKARYFTLEDAIIKEISPKSKAP